MSSSTRQDLGKLVLRLAVGILLLLHGIYKLNYGIGGVEAMLVAKGLPSILGWGAYLGEVVGPVLLVLGIYSRIGGLLVFVNMLFAFALAHMSHLGQVNNMGGWQLELQGLFLFGGLALALLGAGRYSLAGANGRWN